MHRNLLAALGLILLFAGSGAAQESVAEAARKAREKKKDAPKATKTFTNDNLPKKEGRVSVVGSAPAASAEGADGEAKPAAGAEGAAGEGGKVAAKDEASWRARFADQRKKIEQAEKELDILQRELNLMQQQYYSDPNKALREQLERSEINSHRKKIEDKQAEVRQLRQQLSELEDELRRASGPPAWARP